MANDKHDNKHPEVHIQIDRKPLVSPNPTTGAALYILGTVQSGYELFRESHGHGDDESIKNSTDPVELKEGDHFYSAQTDLNPGI